MNKKQDSLFLKPNSQKAFRFDHKISEVFDDMIERSIPHYHELQNKILIFCKNFSKENQVIYDLGCSTGNTLQLLGESLTKTSFFYGIDTSQDMLLLAKKKILKYNNHTFYLQQKDIQKIIFTTSNIILSNLTLQFTDLTTRPRTLKNIYQALQKSGIFIFVEKISIADKILHQIYKNEYYRFKQKKGYSPEEIYNKEKSLKGTLTSLSIKENEEMLRDAGFERNKTSIFYFQHLFCGWICIK